MQLVELSFRPGSQRATRDPSATTASSASRGANFWAKNAATRQHIHRSTDRYIEICGIIFFVREENTTKTEYIYILDRYMNHYEPILRPSETHFFMIVHGWRTINVCRPLHWARQARWGKQRTQSLLKRFTYLFGEISMSAVSVVVSKFHWLQSVSTDIW